MSGLRTHRRPRDGQECAYLAAPLGWCTKCGWYYGDAEENQGPTMLALVGWYALGCIAIAIIIWGFA